MPAPASPKVRKAVLTVIVVALVISTLPVWFSDPQGSGQMRGTQIFNNPLASVGVALALLGIWLPLRGRLKGRRRPISLAGWALVLVAEAHALLSWQPAASPSPATLPDGLAMGPWFYLGVFLTLAGMALSVAWLGEPRDGDAPRPR